MTRKKTRRGVRDKSEKISRILEATRNLVGSSGYHSTSTNHIAQKAGVSIGLVYRYFPQGKNEIIRELVRQDRDRMMVDIEAGEATAEGVTEGVKRLLSEYVDLHRREARFVAAMDAAFLSSPNLFEDYENLMTEEIRPGPRMLAYLQESSGLANDDFESLLKALLQTIDSTVHRHFTSIPIFHEDSQLVDYLAVIVLAVMQVS